MTRTKQQSAGFLDILKETISQFNMIQKKEAILIAVSGGPDSVALVRGLLLIKDEYELTFGIAHLNHELRGAESQRDQDFVKNLAQKLNLPFYLETRDIKSWSKEKGLSLEEAGRNARYEFFSQTACSHGFTKIATGHTRDDNAELVLMNLLRGAGLKGLSGIPPQRNNLFIRPMIHITRSQVMDFLDRQNQNFVVDSSNEDPAFLRNKIRNQLLPLLENDYNPEIRDCLNRTSQILSQENLFLEKHTSLAFKDVLKHRKDDLIELMLDQFNELHISMKQRMARKAIFTIKGDLRRITLRHIQDIIHLASTSETGKSLDLPGQIRVLKTRRFLCFRKEAIPLRDLDRSSH
ncbi:MAG: tRNA lysidine(34) synthetase TilS [Desulfobacteraceae bacterium]|nr:tRNA lysidine(34) synthetase TilS [Desulfobacteraceae bacterium]